MGHSITAMEMHYGFLRKPYEPTAAFAYQRSPSFISSIPTEKERAVFVDCLPGSEVERKRDALREAVKNHQYCKYREYSCSYGGADSEGKPHVTGLDAFQSQVLEDLRGAIEKVFPVEESVVPVTPLELERAFHSHFIDTRSRLFIGRDNIISSINSYVAVNMKQVDPSATVTPLVVVGDAGSGKSSLVASFTARYTVNNPTVFVLPHIIGMLSPSWFSFFFDVFISEPPTPFFNTYLISIDDIRLQPILYRYPLNTTASCRGA